MVGLKAPLIAYQEVKSSLGFISPWYYRFGLDKKLAIRFHINFSD